MILIFLLLSYFFDDSWAWANQMVQNFSKKNMNDHFFSNNFANKTFDTVQFFYENVFNENLFGQDGELLIFEPFITKENLMFLIKNFYSQKHLSPKLIVEVEGQKTLKLKCNWSSKKISWYKKSFEKKNSDIILFDRLYAIFEEVPSQIDSKKADLDVYVDADKNLIIEEFDINDAGLYFCVENDIINELLQNCNSSLNLKSIKTSIEKHFFIEKINFERFSYLVKKSKFLLDDKYFKIKKHILLEFIFRISFFVFYVSKAIEIRSKVYFGANNVSKEIWDHNNFRFYTLWSEWGECLGCDKGGIRTRPGDCYFLIQNETNISNQMVDKSLLNDLNRIFFTFGVPCRLNFHFEYLNINDCDKEILNNFKQHSQCNVNCSDLIDNFDFLHVNNQMNLNLPNLILNGEYFIVIIFKIHLKLN